MKATFAAVLFAAFMTPAVAAEFYIVQDTTTQKCVIVDKKPTVTSKTTIVADGKVFQTRDEADTAMKTVKVCTQQ